MTQSNDNRMGWIRNIKKLQNKKFKNWDVEYEIASETYIPGILNFKNSSILCGLATFDRNKIGLYKYILKIKFAESSVPNFSVKKFSKGYFFKDGIPGELVALFSLFFQSRFFLLSAFWGDLTSTGLKQKVEYNPLYRTCQPYFDPQNCTNKNRNFAVGLPEFLEQITHIDTKYQQNIILACYHYARALQEFGIDEEMVFIRLVSAIEAINNCNQCRELIARDDILYGKEFEDIIKPEVLSNDEEQQLKKIFDLRKSKLRFNRFIEHYSKGFFRGGNYKSKHTRIKKSDLPKVLSNIYDSRSSYLHSGETMYLSRPIKGGNKFHTDSFTDMISDNRKFSGNKKLPYGSFFQSLVRHCILEFIKDVSKKTN
ncbi:MAG: hypothetical protein JXB48_18365 [Candidatus Latescibacteria bacterium]|nr:hypothetical protein [Candidatus Latescibacterota bacterium]